MGDSDESTADASSRESEPGPDAPASARFADSLLRGLVRHSQRATALLRAIVYPAIAVHFLAVVTVLVLLGAAPELVRSLRTPRGAAFGLLVYGATILLFAAASHYAPDDPEDPEATDHQDPRD